MSSRKRKLFPDIVERESRSDIPLDLGSNRVTTHVMKKMQQNIVPMLDSSDIFMQKDGVALWNRFESDGFILLRGLVDANSVDMARSEIFNSLISMGVIGADKITARSKTGWTVDTSSGTIISGADDFASTNGKESSWLKVGQAPSLQKVYRSSQISEALHLLAEGRSQVLKIGRQLARTFHPRYSWLRVKAPEEYTPEHADIFYFKNFTGLFDTEMSTSCALCEKSVVDPHEIVASSNKVQQKIQALIRSGSVARCADCRNVVHVDCAEKIDEAEVDEHESRRSRQEMSQKSCLNTFYCAQCKPGMVMGTCWIPLGNLAVSDGVLAVMSSSTDFPGLDGPPVRGTQLPSGFSKSSLGKTWCVGNYCSGDVVLFNIRAIHCSSKNYGKGYRLSIDGRWCLIPEGHANGSAMMRATEDA